jgi:polyisoprenoid-binding protein YceI
METQTLQRAETKVDAGTTWMIDPAHSTIGFSVTHMMFATVRGRFDDFTGTIQFGPDQVDRSSVGVTIQTASIDTGIGPRDTHLRSADFFDTEHFPIATFRGSSLAGDGKRVVI